MSFIKGERRIIGYRLRSATAFTLNVSDCSLSVTGPDGNAVTPGGTITVTPGTSSLTQDLKQEVPFDQSGAYYVQWSALHTPELLLPFEIYFVGRSPMTDRIRSSQLLGVSAAQMPDTVLDPLLASILSALQSEYSCIGTFNSLSLQDSLNLETAIVYLAASAIQRSNPSRYATGNLVKVVQGPISYQYSDKSGTAINDPYIESAGYHLGLITCIGAQYASFNNSASLFALSGPRRALEVSNYGVALARLSTFADINYLSQYGQILDLNWWYG